MNEDHTGELPQGEPTAANNGELLTQTETPDAAVDPIQPHAETPELSSDPSADLHPDTGTASPRSGEAELDELRCELNRLKASLAERDARNTRIHREYDEFRTLYPDVPLTTLSDALWEDVASGIPLAAAYALAERRYEHEAELARASNADNRKRSTGAVQGGADAELSPSEVRAMSPTDVKRNFTRIMRSMQKWR